MRADEARLVEDALGDTSGVKDDERGARPGLTGWAGAG